jgi:3-carboxy-cis,cis-muconate cycloisomerase
VSGRRLIDGLATTEPLADVFSDASVLQAMLDFEVALARVEARAGVIPPSAADVIEAAARVEAFDADAIARDARQSATAAIPFVAALVERVRAAGSGQRRIRALGRDRGTSPTPRSCCCSQGARPTPRGGSRAPGVGVAASVGRARRHDRRSGARCAAGDADHVRAEGGGGVARRRVQRVGGHEGALEHAAVVQFGGAAGARAARRCRGRILRAGARARAGPRSGAPLAHGSRRLAGPSPPAASTPARSARSPATSRSSRSTKSARCRRRGGGSSTMPHSESVRLRHRARRGLTPAGLVAATVASLVQEHSVPPADGGGMADSQRRGGDDRCSGPAIADTVSGLTVHPDRMRANLDATGGAIFAERATHLLPAARRTRRRAGDRRDGAERQPRSTRQLRRCAA